MLVGHYENDVIVAAERALNARPRRAPHRAPSDGALPGAGRHRGGGAECRRRAGRLSHPGAIIAGLGTVGELTPGQLTRALAQALTSYGAECVGREAGGSRSAQPTTRADGEIAAPVSAVLVGSGEAGVSLKDADPGAPARRAGSPS